MQHYGPNPNPRRPITYGSTLADAHERGDFFGVRPLAIGLLIFFVYVTSVGVAVFFESSRAECVCPDAPKR